MDNPSARVQKLIDTRLIEAYRASVEHFGNSDLVLVFDESRDVDPIDAYERASLSESPDIPDFLKNKLSKPANEASGKLNHAEVAFWLVVYFEDGDLSCSAVKATLMGKAGNA